MKCSHAAECIPKCWTLDYRISNTNSKVCLGLLSNEAPAMAETSKIL